jgi:hypothetical protein
MAEQAQTKLDEVQKNFNEGQGSGQQQGAPPVEYDKHGRPVNSAADAAPAPQPSAPPPGDPLADPAPAATTPTTPATPASPSPEPAKAEGDPLLADEPGSRHGSQPERAPKPPAGGSGMTSGDPLG